MFTRTFDRRIYIALGVFAGSLLFGVAWGMYILWPSHRETGYMPAQPIAFNHVLHATTREIECEYCHSQVRQGAHATVPSIATCMNCHREFQPTDNLGEIKPEMAKLLDHWERKEPVRWVKVNDVADFVYFDHSRHVEGGGLECVECHGLVERMPTVKRQYGLKMRFCLTCHREPADPDSVGAKLGWDTRAPITCTTCHR